LRQNLVVVVISSRRYLFTQILHENSQKVTRRSAAPHLR